MTILRSTARQNDKHGEKKTTEAKINNENYPLAEAIKTNTHDAKEGESVRP